MCLGVAPSELVASVYGLVELYQIGSAMRRGDVQMFEALMQTHQSMFIQQGVYLVLVQAKVICYRTLFKRIAYVITGPKLNLIIFEKVLQSLGEDMELDEIECILCNLISRNMVKGYISHQKRVLMVSKVDAFPTANVVKKLKY